MADFNLPGAKYETKESQIEVTVDPARPLPVGKMRFQLIVVDDAGNESIPTLVEVQVLDTVKPNAVLDAPSSVAYGNSFTLFGNRSVDPVGGGIIRYIWERVA